MRSMFLGVSPPHRNRPEWRSVRESEENIEKTLKG